MWNKCASWGLKLFPAKRKIRHCVHVVYILKDRGPFNSYNMQVYAFYFGDTWSFGSINLIYIKIIDFAHYLFHFIIRQYLLSSVIFKFTFPIIFYPCCDFNLHLIARSYFHTELYFMSVCLLDLCSGYRYIRSLITTWNIEGYNCVVFIEHFTQQLGSIRLQLVVCQILSTKTKLSLLESQLVDYMEHHLFWKFSITEIWKSPRQRHLIRKPPHVFT